MQIRKNLGDRYIIINKTKTIQLLFFFNLGWLMSFIINLLYQ